MKEFYRDSWVEIKLAHIDYNIKQLTKRLRKETNIYAVVKANGYGHGDIEVARTAIDAGAKRLAVALLDEAIKLREAGIHVPILVMGRVRPADVPVAVKYEITLTCYQKEWLEEVRQLELEKPVTVHLKWDTGMGRIGIRSTTELLDNLKLLKHKAFYLEGIFTHFATADEENLGHFESQLVHFQRLREAFEKNWHEKVLFHTGNSAASMRFPDKMFDFVRFGISMYGLYPSPTVKLEQPIDLKPALSLQSRLIHVKKVEPGTTISYGATYTAQTEEWIGTVPLGYADGIRRGLQGSEVLVNGKRCEIVGRICMDQFMIRLTEQAKVGDLVTVIGKQDQEEIEMDELAEKLETINYEIACMISSRVPRIYVD